MFVPFLVVMVAGSVILMILVAFLATLPSMDVLAIVLGMSPFLLLNLIGVFLLLTYFQRDWKEEARQRSVELEHTSEQVLKTAA